MHATQKCSIVRKWIQTNQLDGYDFRKKKCEEALENVITKAKLLMLSYTEKMTLKNRAKWNLPLFNEYLWLLMQNLQE